MKESDRIKAICAMLAVNGVDVEELPDGFIVTGSGAGGVAGGGTVEARHDHRIAMACAVAGLGASSPTTVHDIACVAKSFPGFAGIMQGFGASVVEAAGEDA